jgi:hypothetical protein
MGQELSVSLQAVKTKVYKLIDAMIEGSKTEQEVRESIKRWWRLIHPSDRRVAQKYLLTVLARSQSSLGAIVDGLLEFKEFEPVRESETPRAHKPHPEADRSEVSSTQ